MNTGMRFFTDDADRDEGVWDERAAAYAEHIASIEGQLSGHVLSLATDPGLDLHDARFVRVEVDRPKGRLLVVVNAGSLEVGYRRLSLTFEAAEIAPDNLYLLAEAVGASFRPNHWHSYTAVTEIRWREVDLAPGGRYVVRLRLWPFYAVGITFESLSFEIEELPSRPAARPGRFDLRG